jgi:hypothetical protein
VRPTANHPQNRARQQAATCVEIADSTPVFARHRFVSCAAAWDRQFCLSSIAGSVQTAIQTSYPPIAPLASGSVPALPPANYCSWRWHSCLPRRDSSRRSVPSLPPGSTLQPICPGPAKNPATASSGAAAQNRARQQAATCVEIADSTPVFARHRFVACAAAWDRQFCLSSIADSVKRRSKRRIHR